MAPTLEPGDWVLATRGRARVGAVVVLEHPARPGIELVKRVVAGPGERAPGGPTLGPEEWWVLGDAEGASTDSRTFGPVRAELIRGVARLVYWPPARRRLLSSG